MSGLDVDLPRALFQHQMETLAETGRVVPLDEAVSHLNGHGPCETHPVVLTFDDGTADFSDVALPILERFCLPATVYVATDFVDRSLPFPHGGKPLSWSALADAFATGLVTVGSHTHRHALLNRASPTEIVEELDLSRQLIAEHIGVAARHFAYPKAVRGSATADAAVRARFDSAALAGTRSNPRGNTDQWQLARSPIQVSDGMRWFHRKLDGGMAMEDRLRRVLNRTRYAHITT